MNNIVLCLLLFSFVLIGIGFVAASADSIHEMPVLFTGIKVLPAAALNV